MKRPSNSARFCLFMIVFAVVAVAQEPPAEPPIETVEVPVDEEVVEPPAPVVGDDAPENADESAAGDKPEKSGTPPEPSPLPPEPELAYDKLVKDLKQGSFWLTILVALFFGGLGGVVYELLVLQGNIERFHIAKDDEASEPFDYALPRNLIDLGVWARVIIGGLAAVAAIWLLSPKTGLGLVAGAIIAGSAGTSVFRSLQDRLLATIAQKDAVDTRTKANLQIQKVKQALAQVQAAQGVVVPEGATGERGLTPAMGAGASPQLKEAERLLNEAQGINDTL